MPTTGLHPLDSSIHKTNEWLSQLALDLGVRDKLVALNALRAVLTSLREVLPLDTSAEVSAELPVVVRGIYFENWTPAAEPVGRSELHARIRQQLDPPMEADAVIRAAFTLLDARLSRGTALLVKRALDDDARELWPPASPSSASRMRADSSKPASHVVSRPASDPVKAPSAKPSSRRG